MTVIEFVTHRFVPEYVHRKTSAGRAHFQTILKHVLTPAGMECAFRPGSGKSKDRRKTSSDWPYMDSILLDDVTPENVQHLVSKALERGYSIQTATHIRNVIRTLFAYAKSTRSFSGENPAAKVTLPGMIRREAHVLTLDQLKLVIQSMKYPEREIALIAILTKMNISEICGLQWKHVNLSDAKRPVDVETLAPRTVAIRKQSYRGEIGLVMPSRRRDIPIPELMYSVLSDLRIRSRFTGPEDFVLASRAGTPIRQDNVAMRRLKGIRQEVGMPWLSWNVFQRTHLRLYSENARYVQSELKRAITLERTIMLVQREPPGGNR